jgi:hypothetical protein
MLWKHNRNWLSKELCTLFITRDLHVWRLWGPTYRLKCTKIWRFQKLSMVERGFPHLLEILNPPFRFWVPSILHGLPKTNVKRNYQQFGLCTKKSQILKKLQQTWRTSKRRLGKDTWSLFIMVLTV